MSYNENPSYQLINQSGTQKLIQSSTASNSASINFITGIIGFDNYYLLFYNVTLSQSSNLLLQLSTNAGSTYSTTGYIINGYFADAGGQTFTSQTPAGFYLAYSADTVSTVAITGNCQIFELSNSSFNKQTIVNSVYQNSSNSITYSAGGAWATQTAVNALKIVPSAGNITTGKFKLYGINN